MSYKHPSIGPINMGDYDARPEPAQAQNNPVSELEQGLNNLKKSVMQIDELNRRKNRLLGELKEVEGMLQDEHKWLDNSLQGLMDWKNQH